MRTLAAASLLGFGALLGTGLFAQTAPRPSWR